MVTNGGYGGVQQALANGVPLVVAGDSEDKPEVAARSSGRAPASTCTPAGPSVAMVARAVRRVLARPSYRERARALQAEIAATDPLGDISGRWPTCARRTLHARRADDDPQRRTYDGHRVAQRLPAGSGHGGSTDDRARGRTVALLPAGGPAGRARRPARRRRRLLLADRVHAAAGQAGHEPLSAGGRTDLRGGRRRRRARARSGRAPSGRFTYTKTVLGDDTAFLEFETTMEGKYVNGVDIIRATTPDASLSSG